MCVPLHSRIVTNTPCFVYSCLLYTVHLQLTGWANVQLYSSRHWAQRSSSRASPGADTHINNTSTALLFVSENYSLPANIMALVSKYLIGTRPKQQSYYPRQPP